MLLYIRAASHLFMRILFLVLFCWVWGYPCYSQSASYHYNRGTFLSSNGDYNEAMIQFSKALEFDPVLQEAWFNRGIAKYKLGDIVNAIKDLSKAIQLKPDDAEAHFNRAVCRAKSNDLAGALQDYNRAILLNPMYGQAYMNRGNCRYKLNDKTGACNDWDRASNLGFKDANNAKFCSELMKVLK